MCLLFFDIDSPQIKQVNGQGMRGFDHILAYPEKTQFKFNRFIKLTKELSFIISNDKFSCNEGRGLTTWENPIKIFMLSISAIINNIEDCQDVYRS